MALSEQYLESAIKEFQRYKTLGDKTFARLSEKEIHWRFNEETNSIAIIVKHMVGNMLSRWTNFLTEDGEKPWRKRDTEFEDPYSSKEEMLQAWENGWQCVFKALRTINEDNFHTHIRIRNEQHNIFEAVNRQLGHYAYHTGQIITTAKNILGERWQSLSIPKGGSEEFNNSMFKK